MCSVHRSTATSGMAVFSDGKSSKIGGPVIHIFGPALRWKITVNRPGIQTIGPKNDKNNTLKVQTEFPGKAPVFISDLIINGYLRFYTKRSKVYTVRKNTSVTLYPTIRPSSSTRKLESFSSKPINHVLLCEVDFAKEHCTMISSMQRKYVGWRRSNKRLE